MLRLSLVVCLLVAVTAVGVSAVEVTQEGWPLSTLLEHTAIASDKFAPEGRNRLEKLQLTQAARQPEYLGARNDQIMYHGADARGGSDATSGERRENNGRAREPNSPHFGAEQPLGPVSDPLAPKSEDYARAPRQPCSGAGCEDANEGPRSIPPEFVPPPPGPKLPPKPSTPEEPQHAEFPEPPPPENPLATPPMPGCGELCDPNAKDPLLARIPEPPLNDLDIAAVGLEGTVLAKVMQKLRNREGWLRAQKLWLSKAVEAAATVRREIELAEFTKDAVASDLEQLKMAQDALSIKYKADRLKWSFKDKKITLEALRERLEALKHAEEDVAHQIRAEKDEVIILENTLGPPSQQVQISPKELEDPLGFLADVVAEHNYNSYD